MRVASLVKVGDVISFQAPREPNPDQPVGPFNPTSVRVTSAVTAIETLDGDRLCFHTASQVTHVCKASAYLQGGERR